MGTQEKIYVSMTSWYRRINNVLPVVKSLMSQTLSPYKIILNFCTEDFPRMEEDLPGELLQYAAEHADKIEIFWFIENYRAWKKHLHVLDIVSDDDLIICADDDHMYPADFIEKMYMSYVHYGKKFPVTSNKIMLVHNTWTFNGSGTLYRKKDLGPDYKKYLTHDILHKCAEDVFLSVLLPANNVFLAPMIYEFPPDKELLYNDEYAFTDPEQYVDNAGKVTSSYTEFLESTSQAVKDTFQEHYIKYSESLKGSTKYSPNVWLIRDQFQGYLVNNYKEPSAAMKFVIDAWDKFYLKGNAYDIPREKLSIDRRFDTGRFELTGGRRIVVTMSSWTKRIGNVAAVLKTILKNTVLPDYIILNLARPDFNIPVGHYPTDEELRQALPEDLVELLSSQGIVKIHWYDDNRIRSWKKYLYILEACRPDDIVIAIDDDILYKDTFIETMVKSWNYYGKEFPVSAKPASMVQGMYGICGYALLFCPEYLYGMSPNRSVNDIVSDDMKYLGPEDNYLLLLFGCNMRVTMPVIGYDYLFDDTYFNQGESNYGMITFDDKFYSDLAVICDEANRIISKIFADRPEMKSGWIPKYYGFVHNSVYNYLEEYKDKHLNADDNHSILKLVYNEYKKKYEGDFGHDTYSNINEFIGSIKL